MRACYAGLHERRIHATRKAKMEDLVPRSSIAKHAKPKEELTKKQESFMISSKPALSNTSPL